MTAGLEVYNHVKSTVGGKIGIHGESLGGAVASHIASRGQVDFLFADRTFASLYDVAFYGIGGKWIAKVFIGLTCWRESLENDFLGT